MFTHLYESVKETCPMSDGRYQPDLFVEDVFVKPSPTADTRACDVSKVDKTTLLASSEQHIRDVQNALLALASLIAPAGMRHDHDKISGIDEFHNDFKTKFEKTGWYDNHRKVNRHHLDKDDGVPEDVNLIDVLEHIADCVTAGMARSGKVTPLKLSNDVLQTAFQNTVELLKRHVKAE